MEERKYTQNYKLRQARELRGWTQKDVAENIELPDPRTFRRWESGEATPSLRYRARLCEVFEMSPEELGFTPMNHLRVIEKKNQSPKASNAVRDEVPVAPPPFQPLPPSDKPFISSTDWNRRQLLGKVYTFWIKEVLEPSLSGLPYLALDLQRQADATANPWSQIIQKPHLPLSAPSSSTSITQVYDEACGELLILGEAGAGKTTLLLELARHLLQRAFENEAHPIPTVFNLSSWSIKKLPLTDWLIEELSSKYQVPPRIGQTWVEQDAILPLLDGLDEVPGIWRKLCVETINTYRQSHGLSPLVVCSRKEEFLHLASGILLRQAVCIEPLRREQIDSYLAHLGEQGDALRFTIDTDPQIYQLLSTPLLCKVLTRTSQNQPVEQLNEPGALERFRHQLVATYVHCMLEYRNAEQFYSFQDCLHWLAHIASQMKRHNQTEIHLSTTGEHVQCLTITPWSWMKAQKNVVSSLRQLLRWLGGSIPRDTLHFLDYVAEHLLLRKTGDGYRFANQLLLNYFASLSESS